MIDRELMEQMIEEEKHRYANAATRLEKTVDDLVCESKMAVLELRNAEDYIRNLNADKSPKTKPVCAHCGVELKFLSLLEGESGLMDVLHNFTFIEKRPTDGKAVIEVETGYSNWLKPDMTPEKAIEHIKCPCCGKFPFDVEKVNLKSSMTILLYPNVKNIEKVNTEDN